MQGWIRFAAGAALLCSAWASPAVAKTPAVETEAVPPEVAKVLDSVQTLFKQDNTSEDFGAGVAVSDRYAIVGAPDESIGGVKSGAVYVFERYPTPTGSAYRLLERMQSPPSPPPTPGPPIQTIDRFGQSVAVFGETIVIGAPGIAGAQPSIGRVRFYVRNPLATAPPFFNEVEFVEPSALETPEIVNPTGARFGHVVGLNGPFLFVGAPEAAVATGPSTSVPGGAVVIYKCTNVRGPSGLQWNCAKQTVVRAPDLTAGQQFGFSLAAQKPPTVADLVLVVGAPAGPNCPLPPPGPCTPVPTGAMYTFTGIDTTWNFRRKYTPAAGAAGDRYGHAVAHVGPSVAVGAPNDDGQKGTVRILEGPDPANLMENTTLRAPSGTEMMHFGGKISLFNQHIAIAAPERTVGGNAQQGAVFLHERIAAGQWVLREEVTRPFQAAGAQFGAGLALTGDILVVGEPDGPTGSATAPGRAYVYFLGRPISRVTNAASAPGDDRFGSAVARDGDVMVVGLPGKESGPTAGVGVVQVFLRNASGDFPTIPDQTIQPPAGEVVPNLAFGASVSLSANGSELVVGAPGALVNGAASAGAVFVFPRQQATYATALPPVLKLVQPDLPVANALFGASVDIGPGGTPIVVGAPGSANGGRGGVYVFEEGAARGKDGAIAKDYSGSSVAPGASASIGDKWGASVSTDGTTIAAGATEADDASGGGGEDGYVTLIGDTVNGYATSSTIDAPADDANAIGDKQSFGAAVDIDDGVLVVGAPLTDVANDSIVDANDDEGTAYAYAVDAGAVTDVYQVSAPSGAIGDKWGTSVAVSNGTVASGGPGTDVATETGTSTDQGAVITFECDDDSCDFDQTMYGLNASSGEAVGSSIAFDGEEFVVGAPEADPNGTNAGAIYTGADLYSSAAVANDDSGLAVAEDSSGNVLAVLANDTASLDSGPAVVIGVGTPTHGAASVGTNGANVVYTPAANYCGPDAFTYSLDGGSVGDVSLTVSCVNDAPVAVGSIAGQTAAEDAAVNIPTASSFSDIDDATLAYQAAGLPAGLSINASGTITGTIAAGASALSPYAVTITARDAANAQAQQQFPFTVTAPVAGGDLIFGNGFE